MELGPDHKRKDVELEKSQEIVTKCEACGSEEFRVSDTAEPVGSGGSYTAKVICEECGTPARVFEVQESDL